MYLVSETYSYFVLVGHRCLLAPQLSNRALVTLWTVALLLCGPAFSAGCLVGLGFSALRNSMPQPDLSIEHQSDSVTHL